MRLWHILRTRTASLLLRRRREAELREELQQHIERETERLRAMGSHRRRRGSRPCALRRRRADQRAVPRRARHGGLDALSRDTRHAARRLDRDWRFTAAAVPILGLGIGANTAIFSLVNATLFRRPALADPRPARRPLPERHQPRRRRRQLVSGLPGHGRQHRRVRGRDRGAGAARRELPRRRRAAAGPSPSTRRRHYLSVLGLQPSLGRWFTAAEDAPGAAVVAVARPRGVDGGSSAPIPSVIGRTIRIDGVPVTIVGVGPAGHRGTINIGLVTDFWLPIASLPALGAPPRALTRRPGRSGVLREGAPARRRHRGAGAGRDANPRHAAGRRVPEGGSGQGHRGVRVERRAHPSADGRPAACRRLHPARRRRAGAGDRVQQPGDAAARPRRRLARRRSRCGSPSARRAASSFASC